MEVLEMFIIFINLRLMLNIPNIFILQIHNVLKVFNEFCSNPLQQESTQYLCLQVVRTKPLDYYATITTCSLNHCMGS